METESGVVTQDNNFVPAHKGKVISITEQGWHDAFKKEDTPAFVTMQMQKKPLARSEPELYGQLPVAALALHPCTLFHNP